MMGTDSVIQVDRVSKKFCRNLKHSMWYGFKDIVRDSFGFDSKPWKLRPDEFWAANEISFEARASERLGIIGFNGSGKTTLLKMLNGILRPDKGRLAVKGRVGALIAVGAGFHPQLTGRENIYVNGSILGMSKQRIDEKFQSIVEFAEIGDFLETPVKFYSSGMFVRLGFAVAAHCNPDILLIDEVLAVGDISFQAKCLGRLAELRKNGVTTILVSHHMPKIGSFCERVLYLSEGKIKVLDKPNIAISAFENDMHKTKGVVVSNGCCHGYKPLGGVTLENVKFAQKHDNEIKIEYSQSIRLSFDYDLQDKELSDCAFAVLVKRVSDGVICFGVLSNYNGFRFTEQKGRIEVSISGHNLVPDMYNIDTQIRTISNDASYAAFREPRLIVSYPNDRYILKNLAGVFQPNKVIWRVC
ncbi:ABC transporter ATP-binding protein [Candidatus Pacearchaeota archaeon]|nr:ABC transporter ATP-binding protein [Candidatus Pacearchaeota archaeon]